MSKVKKDKIVKEVTRPADIIGFEEAMRQLNDEVNQPDSEESPSIDSEITSTENDDRVTSINEIPIEDEPSSTPTPATSHAAAAEIFLNRYTESITERVNRVRSSTESTTTASPAHQHADGPTPTSIPIRGGYIYNDAPGSVMGVRFLDSGGTVSHRFSSNTSTRTIEDFLHNLETQGVRDEVDPARLLERQAREHEQELRRIASASQTIPPTRDSAKATGITWKSIRKDPLSADVLEEIRFMPTAEPKVKKSQKKEKPVSKKAIDGFEYGGYVFRRELTLMEIRYLDKYGYNGLIRVMPDVKYDESKVEINPDEECIVNIMELADDYAVEELRSKIADFDIEKHNDEYQKVLTKHINKILSFKRTTNG